MYHVHRPPPPLNPIRPSYSSVPNKSREAVRGWGGGVIFRFDVVCVGRHAPTGEIDIHHNLKAVSPHAKLLESRFKLFFSSRTNHEIFTTKDTNKYVCCNWALRGGLLFRQHNALKKSNKKRYPSHRRGNTWERTKNRKHTRPLSAATNLSPTSQRRYESCHWTNVLSSAGFARYICGRIFVFWGENHGIAQTSAL